MSDYLRPRVPGALVFFTVALAARGSWLLVDEVDRLRDAVAATRAERPFGIAAWVVLPDHLHCVWQLPEGDADYSVRWGAIKARFTRAVVAGRPGFTPASDATRLPTVTSGRYAGVTPRLRVAKGERGIWQRRYWEHHIRDEADLAAHLRYCWWNPVKHGLVAAPEDWPYSSFRRDAAAGRVDWVSRFGGGA